MAISINPPPLADDQEFTQRWRDYLKEVNDSELISLLNIEHDFPYNQIDFDSNWIDWMRELHRALAIIETSFPQNENEWNYVWTNYHRILYNYLKRTAILNSSTTIDSSTALYNYVDASGGNLTFTMGTPSGVHKFTRVDTSNNEVVFDATTNNIYYKGDPETGLDLVEARAAFTVEVNSSSNWEIAKVSRTEPSEVLSTSWVDAGNGSSAGNTLGSFTYSPGDGSAPPSWSNPGNIISDNNSDATVNLGDTVESDSEILRAYNYGLGSVIPSGANILGFEFKVEHFLDPDAAGASNAVFSQAYIIKNSGGLTTKGNELSDLVNVELELSRTSDTAGSSVFLAGETWTLSEISDSDFGWGLKVDNLPGTDTAHIDYMQMKIYYRTALDVVKGNFVNNEPNVSVC